MRSIFFIAALLSAQNLASSFRLPGKMGGFRNGTVVTTSPKPSFLGMFSLNPQITVSKFPPFMELLVQRIQAQFSNYIHEDLSRPQTYDRPVYTLAPDEIAAEDDELPLALKPPIMIMIETFELINSDSFNSTTEIEHEIASANRILQGAGKGYSYNTTILEGVRSLLGKRNRPDEIIGIIGFNETTNYNIFGEDGASFANRFNETVRKNVSTMLENERGPRKSQILIAITKGDSKIFANIIEVLKGENRDKFMEIVHNSTTERFEEIAHVDQKKPVQGTTEQNLKDELTKQLLELFEENVAQESGTGSEANHKIENCDHIHSQNQNEENFPKKVNYNTNKNEETVFNKVKKNEETPFSSNRDENEASPFHKLTSSNEPIIIKRVQLKPYMAEDVSVQVFNKIKLNPEAQIFGKMQLANQIYSNPEEKLYSKLNLNQIPSENFDDVDESNFVIANYEPTGAFNYRQTRALNPEPVKESAMADRTLNPSQHPESTKVIPVVADRTLNPPESAKVIPVMAERALNPPPHPQFVKIIPVMAERALKTPAKPAKPKQEPVSAKKENVNPEENLNIEERGLKVPAKNPGGFRPKPDPVKILQVVVTEEDIDPGTGEHYWSGGGYLDGEDEYSLRKQDVEYEFSTKRTTSWPLDEIGRK